MSEITRRTALVWAGTGAAALTATERVATAAEPATWPGRNATPDDWPQFMGYADHRAYAQTETHLTPQTVPSLAVLWSSPEDSLGDGMPTVLGDAVFTGGYGVTRRRTSTGAVEWKHGLGEVWTSIAYAHGILVAVTKRPNKVVALDPATGKVLWSRSTLNSMASPTIRDRSVYVATDSAVLCFDVATGARRWSRDIPRDVEGTHGSPTVAGGRVFVGTGGNGLVTALSAATGVVLWQHRFGRGGLYGSDVSSLAADAAGRLFGGLDEGTAFALDQTTGAVRWSRRIGGSVESGVSVTPTSVLVPSYGKALFALDPGTGATQWAAPLTKYTGPEPASGGGVAYLTMPAESGQQDGTLRAFDLRDGSELARVALSIDTPTSGPAISRGRLYLNGLNRVYCVGLPT